MTDSNPNGITYRHLVSVCRDNTVPEKALQHNVITCSAPISACGWSNFLLRALQPSRRGSKTDSGPMESTAAIRSAHAEGVICQRGPCSSLT